MLTKKADFEHISKQFGIDPAVARVIRNRDVISDEEIDMYLNGTLDNLGDMSLMKDADKALHLIAEAINAGKNIRIVGDYDVDGICSIYILYKGLTALGGIITYDIPDRIGDGYGINDRIVEKAHDEGVNMIITCDNGITAIEQANLAKSLGMDFIVTDHHDVHYEEKDGVREYSVPDALAVVDAWQEDCLYPYKDMCGAGLVYRLMERLFTILGKNVLWEKIKDGLVEIAAIATIADVVKLQGENRVIVKEGLKRIRKTKNVGLRNLIEAKGIDINRFKAVNVAFGIGPCLNASGRLESAMLGLDLLLEEDENKAADLATKIVELNNERRAIQDMVQERAIEEASSREMINDKILVIYVPGAHESVCGLAAGKVRERFYKPTIILTDGADGNLKGSARSIEAYNIFEGLVEVGNLLLKFGGHPAAAGMSLKKENLDAFRKALNDNCNLSDEDMIERVNIDLQLPLGYVSVKLIEDLELLEPCGMGNEKPCFADRNLKILSYSAMGRDGQYARMVLSNEKGHRMTAVCFNDCEGLRKAYDAGEIVSVIFYPEINEYRGTKNLQINVKEYRIEKQ